MSEKALWKWFKEHVAVHGYWERVENLVGTGTPDVHYCIDGYAGWIELKEIEDWPVRAKTIVRIDHFTLEQRYWLREYYDRGGGNAWLLVRVRAAREYFLFRPDSADAIGTMNQEEFRRAAYWSWLGKMDKTDLKRFYLMIRKQRVTQGEENGIQ